MFWCVSYYLGAFGTVWLRNNTYCKTGRTGEKLRAKKSHRNFFATNAPDSPHWTLYSYFGLFSTIWVHLGLFGCLTKLGAKQVELVQKFVPRSRVGFFRNEVSRSNPCDPKPTFWCVRTIYVHSGLFGALRNSMQNGPNKWKSSCHEVASEFFCNKSTRSTPLYPKLKFWCVSYYLGAFGTIWLPYETRCKTGHTSAKVRETKSHRIFSQRTHPIHLIGP